MDDLTQLSVVLLRWLLVLGVTRRQEARVKCVSDAGYFIHDKDISEGSYIQSYYSKVVALHGSAKSLPLSCTSKMKPELCFFPQYVVPSTRTPLFVINAAFYSWQVRYVYIHTNSLH